MQDRHPPGASQAGSRQAIAPGRGLCRVQGVQVPRPGSQVRLLQGPMASQPRFCAKHRVASQACQLPNSLNPHPLPIHALTPKWGVSKCFREKECINQDKNLPALCPLSWPRDPEAPCPPDLARAPASSTRTPRSQQGHRESTSRKPFPTPGCAQGQAPPPPDHLEELPSSPEGTESRPCPAGQTSSP